MPTKSNSGKVPAAFKAQMPKGLNAAKPAPKTKPPSKKTYIDQKPGRPQQFDKAITPDFGKKSESQ